MNPFDIDPNNIQQELNDFNNKLAQGLNTLAKLGDVDVGASERELVYKEDKLSLYRYKAQTEKQNNIPVLVVYALVNRPYMADLQNGRSLIQGLLNVGLDVYLIDWGYPDASDRYLSLDDYINGYLDRCIDKIRANHALEKINLLGICQGGTFCLCYCALHRGKIKNLITTVTPVDFHTKNDQLSHQVKYMDIDKCVDAFGNIPGDLLNLTFLMLKPYRLLGQKYVDLVNILDNADKAKNFMRMEKWIFDSPNQAGEAFRQFLKEFYQENKLIKGTIKIGDETVNLRNINIPILNIFARDDHLVPPESSKALAGYIGNNDYTEMEFPGGHIGIYVSKKSRKLLPPAIGNWINERS